MFGWTAWAKEIPGEYLVKVRGDALKVISSLQSSGSIAVMDANSTAQLLKVFISEANKTKGLETLFSHSQVEYVVPNVVVESFRSRVDATNQLRDQYALRITKTPEAWAKAQSKGNKKVVVAVIDTGIDHKHPDLAPNYNPNGFDFFDNDRDPMDIPSQRNPGHGTHCAGIVGASGTLADGVAGVSPVVSMMAIRFLGPEGQGDLNNGVKAIDHAVAQKVDIISASWGAKIPPSAAQPIVEAIQRAEAAGIVFVAAAGNDGADNDTANFFPTNAPTNNMIAVAATNESDQKASFSNHGRRNVHVGAPGEKIMSTVASSERYRSLSGTSMAAPFVSGLSALLKSIDGSLRPDEIRAVLQASGDSIEINNQCRCRVNSLAAATMVADRAPFLVPAAGTISSGQTPPTFRVRNGVAPFKFTSSNESVATVDSSGVMSVKGQGEVIISVTDANGKTASSKTFFVGASAPPPPPENDCPFQDPMICELACAIDPSFPWCKKN
jgi:thermitase